MNRALLLASILVIAVALLIRTGNAPDTRQGNYGFRVTVDLR